MKQILTILAFGLVISCTAQQLTLKKGIIIDSLSVRDSISETFSLYLPSSFEVSRAWPVLFVFDMKGRGKQALSMFKEAAEQQGYILAASNDLRDSAQISKNIIVANRMFNAVTSLLPIHKNRIYTGGFSAGGRFSTLIPTFIKGVQGVLACGAPVANTEVLSSKNPFHFIGVVGNGDYNYTEMLAVEKALNKLKFPNQLLVFDGDHKWPATEYLAKSLEIFTMAAMAKGHIPKDTVLVEEMYRNDLARISRLYTANKPLMVDNLLGEMLEVYRPFKSTDSIKDSQKTLKKSKLFRTQYRGQNALFFKEGLIKDDYVYYLEEDVLTYNYNNLGWWKYQMEELEKFHKSPDMLQQQMGMRLKGYVNALVADNLDYTNAGDPVDMEALNFLRMLKTVIDPTAYENYLNIISYSAKIDDYGTALFYVEELLKKGYTNRAKLYSIENTALLRITPEFNEIVEKYLKDARYDIIEE